MGGKECRGILMNCLYRKTNVCNIKLWNKKNELKKEARTNSCGSSWWSSQCPPNSGVTCFKWCVYLSLALKYEYYCVCDCHHHTCTFVQVMAKLRPICDRSRLRGQPIFPTVPPQIGKCWAEKRVLFCFALFFLSNHKGNGKCSDSRYFMCL